jgi:hypothetical protein
VRSILEEPRVQRAVDEAEDKWPRARDSWEAVTWIVARDPKAGKPATESGRIRAFTFEGASSIGLPSVTVIYEITDEAIVVHDATFMDARHGPAGRA